MNEPPSICLSFEGRTFDELKIDWSVLMPALDLSAMGDDPYAVISELTFVSLSVSTDGDAVLHYKYRWHLFHACRDFREETVSSASIGGTLRSGNLLFPVLARASDRSTADEL